MKNLFLMSMAAAGMIFTACSNDETVEVAQNQNAIGFSTFVNNSARATDATTANLTEFKVWGLMNKDTQTGTPFVDVTVTKNGTEWSYETPKYWEKGYAYSFVALAPEDYTFTAPEVINTWGSLTFQNDGETDLIYAAAKQETIGDVCPAAVNLNFNHMLSRVRFQFTNGMADGSEIKVTDVKITDACKTGKAALDIDFSNLAWREQNGTLELAFTPTDEALFVQGKTGTTDHRYMIPTQEKAYNVTFTVTRRHHNVTDTYEHQVTIPSTVTIEAGKSYQFCTTLDASNINPEEELCPIVFKAEVANWENANWGDTSSDIKFPKKEEAGSTTE